MPDPLPSPPKLGPAPSGPPPRLPEAFDAVILLTPFERVTPVVAAVKYMAAANAMAVELNGVAGGWVAYVNLGSDTYIQSEPDGPWTGPWDLGWTVPPVGMLSDMQATGVATAPVLGVQCDWWASLSTCTNGSHPGSPEPPPRVGSWTWTAADTGLPWRMFFVDKSNPYRLPAIGGFAMLNWASVQTGEPEGLAALVERCRTSAQAPPEGLDPAPAARLAAGGPSRAESLIPGLHAPTGNEPLPVWPDTLAMAATTVPTAQLTVMPTVIAYDWPIERMLTRLLDQEDAGYTDLVLTGSQTYEIDHPPGGEPTCTPGDPVGLPRPNWPESDGGEVMAVIDGGTNLSPFGTTELIALPSDSGRSFWVWYTTPADRAVLFCEVPQLCDVGLVLIDYLAYDPGVEFDPSIFEIPCLKDEAAGASAAAGRGVRVGATIGSARGG